MCSVLMLTGDCLLPPHSCQHGVTSFHLLGPLNIRWYVEKQRQPVCMAFYKMQKVMFLIKESQFKNVYNNATYRSVALCINACIISVYQLKKSLSVA